MIPNTPFTDGQIWSPELAYLAFNQVYDDTPQYLGHHTRLTDDSLSNQPGNIKDRLKQVLEPFKVTVSTGRVLNYTSGVLRGVSGELLSIPGGSITVPDDSTSYIYVNSSNQVQVGVPSVFRLLLAKVITTSGTVSQVTDLRDLSIRQVSPATSAIRVFGGSSGLDKVCTQGEILDLGQYFCRDFIVPAGVTVTVRNWVKVVCSGTCRIEGSLIVTPMAAGAATYGIVPSGGVQGGLSGTGIGAGSGSYSPNSSTSYPFGAQAYGSGGGLGFTNGNAGSFVIPGIGGRGGGGVWIEAGNSVLVHGAINAIGENGGSVITLSGSAKVSGAGGGSGGLIYLSSLKEVIVHPSATLDVRGGSGGSAMSTLTNSHAAGGNGGGGGTIVLVSPSNNVSGSTIVLAGGALGAASGANPDIGGGGGGGFGGNGGTNYNAGSIGRLVLLNYTPLG